MPEEISEIIVVTIAGSAVVLLLLVFLLSFFFVFQRRQLRYEQERLELHAQYAQEILHTQLEVQNATLQLVSQELHDNVGQLLSVAKINLHMLEEMPDLTGGMPVLLQASELVNQAILDVRALTKSFDGDFIRDFGLKNGLTQELSRLARTNRFHTCLELEGIERPLGYDREIVLFRVFQELLTNTIKHADATSVTVRLSYASDAFAFQFTDNGVGFDLSTAESQTIGASGAGLRNIRRRIGLIGGSVRFESRPLNGLNVFIDVPPA